MGTLLVVVDQAADQLSWCPVEVQEVKRPDDLFLVGLDDPLEEGVAVQVAIGSAAELDAEVAREPDPLSRAPESEQKQPYSRSHR